MSPEALSAGILTFWFGDPSQDDVTYRTRRKLWFKKSAAFDGKVRRRFEAVYRQATSEGWALSPRWQSSAAVSLALVLLLDQFPRNMFRGTPAAFASDPQAQAVASRAIASGFDSLLPPIQQMFFYYPLEHSESLSAQQQAATLFRALTDDCAELQDALDFALRHQQVIERFGRFPHRNPILGRRSTSAEVAFLKRPGSSF